MGTQEGTKMGTTKEWYADHAAHYGYGRTDGHDIAGIDIQAEKRPAAPVGYSFHIGYLENGAQWWSFTKCVPWRNKTCSRCPVEKAINDAEARHQDRLADFRIAQAARASESR